MVFRASAGICGAPQAVNTKVKTAAKDLDDVRDMATRTMPLQA